MTTVELFPAACGLLYLCAAIGYAMHGQIGWALTYFAYAGANIGLIMAAIEGRR